MRRILAALMTVLFVSGLALADERSDDLGRIQSAATVLDEIMAARDKGVPEDILGSAKCVAVVPSMLKGAFIVGVNRGKGIASCRTANGWSAPAFFVIEGGSFGFQIGGQAISHQLTDWKMLGQEAMDDPIHAVGGDGIVFTPPGEDRPLGRDQLAKMASADLVAYYAPFQARRAELAAIPNHAWDVLAGGAA